MGEELSKLGEVDKITLFANNPDGVIVVKFASAPAAEACIQLMDKRWFAKVHGRNTHHGHHARRCRLVAKAVHSV